MIYLASPFSSHDKKLEKRRYDEVMEYVAFVINRQKVPIISPILHCYPMHLKYQLPGNAEFWKTFNTELITRADELRVLMLDGWMGSLGVNMEVQLAKKLKKTLSFAKPYMDHGVRLYSLSYTSP